MLQKSNADAPTIHPQTGSLVFAKPHEEDQPFSDFLTYVIHQEKTQGLRQSEVRYAQTRRFKPTYLIQFTVFISFFMLTSFFTLTSFTSSTLSLLSPNFS